MTHPDAEDGAYFIGDQRVGSLYAWGLPPIATRQGRAVTVTSLRIRHVPAGIADITFARFRYDDFGTGIGIISGPLSDRASVRYRPLPAVGVVYDSETNDDFVVAQFRLTKATPGELRDFIVEYREGGTRYRQVLKANLLLQSPFTSSSVASLQRTGDQAGAAALLSREHAV